MSDHATNLSNELLSFKKSIASNNREAIDKYLMNIKNLHQDFLNQALFWCIENYKVEEQTDQCLHCLLRYTSENNKSKANPNCEINAETPLIAACRKGQLSLVKRLIENGAKPDLTNSKNQHPLEFLLSSRQQNYDIADYLITQMQSVNFSIKNKHPIIIAMERQFFRIFKSILEKGCDLVYEEGNLLHYMMKQKFKSAKTKKKFMKQLTNKHHLFTQMDKNGKIPIDYEQNQEVKAFYLENFKVKKAPEPVEKPILNNSSIFINTKITKRDTKPNFNDKKKNLSESTTFGNKQNCKEFAKDTKISTKDNKDEDLSFEEDIEDKSEGEVDEDEKFTQKIVKMVNQPAINQAKKPSQPGKTNQNSSFVSNSSPSNHQRDANKGKSKYSGIGSKTQTNLKNSFLPKKYEPKKYPNLNSSTSQQPKETKKKGSFEDDKKQVGNSKKTSILNDKIQSQEDIKPSKGMKDEETDKITLNQDSAQEEDIKCGQENQVDEISRQVEEVIKKQDGAFVETLQIENDDLQVKLPKKEELIEVVKKSEWEIVLESCEKMMETLIIKEEHEITDLKELKTKFNDVFNQYSRSAKSIIGSEQKIKDGEKLKQLKTYINQSTKSIILPPSKFCFLNQQMSQIESTCASASEKMSVCIRESINFITKKVQFALQSGRKQHIEVSIDVYGSRANGLDIETSDTDLLIICNVNAGVKDLMLELERSGAFVIFVLFQNCSEINEVKYLMNTSMPIMKLSLSSDFMHMNVDLTFQIRGHTGIRCTSLIKQFTAAEVLLKPLVVTLKTLLNCYELCDTYTGGVGSYSLTLMTIALLQMDYICQAIIIHPPGFNQRPAFSIYQLPYSLDLTPKLIIYDPLNPVNNVGRATYRIVQLKIWYVKLRTQLAGKKDGLEELMKAKEELLKRTALVQKL